MVYITLFFSVPSIIESIGHHRLQINLSELLILAASVYLKYLIVSDVYPILVDGGTGLYTYISYYKYNYPILKLLAY